MFFLYNISAGDGCSLPSGSCLSKMQVLLIESWSVGLKGVRFSKKFRLNGSTSNISQNRFYGGQNMRCL